MAANRAVIDPLFLLRVRASLQGVQHLPFGKAKEQGGSFVLSPVHPTPTLVPGIAADGTKDSVRLPVAPIVWHTHPATCNLAVEGCSYDPPSDTDMANAYRNGLLRGQIASIVFAHKGVYVVQMRTAFRNWVVVNRQRPERCTETVRRAFDRFQESQKLADPDGPEHKKETLNKSFIKAWLAFARSYRLCKAGPKVFRIGYYKPEDTDVYVCLKP